MIRVLSQMTQRTQQMRQHAISLGLTLLASLLLSVLAFGTGSLKPMASIDWMDFFGEATSSVMAAIWFVLLILCRPKGRVTGLLLFGSATYWLTTWLDLLDEVIAYPADSHLFSWLESLPAPISMLLLTWGLAIWYGEQIAVNRQLKQREHFHREHSLIDPVTQLYSLSYLRIQLHREALLHDKRSLPLSLVMVDIDDFSRYNRLHGAKAGDNALKEVAAALEIALRETDLACRYASDRFVILLPDTQPDEVGVFSQLIENCCSRALKGALKVTTVAVTRLEHEQDEPLFSRLNQKLASVKRTQSTWEVA